MNFCFSDGLLREPDVIRGGLGTTLLMTLHGSALATIT